MTEQRTPEEYAQAFAALAEAFQEMCDKLKAEGDKFAAAVHQLTEEMNKENN